MGKPRSKKQIHQDIDNYVIVNEEIVGDVPAGKFKNTITFDGIIHSGTSMTNNQLAALIAGLTTTVTNLSTTVNDLSTTVTNQHNLVMGEIKSINGEIKVIKHDIVDIKHKLDEHTLILAEHDKKFELVFSILDSHTKIFARNNLK